MATNKKHTRSSSAPAAQYDYHEDDEEEKMQQRQYHRDDCIVVIRGGSRRTSFRPRPINTKNLRTLNEKSKDLPSASAVSNTSSASTVVDDTAYSIFSPTKKRVIVVLASMAAFFSPFSANSYFPALAKIEQVRCYAA